jgi:hypothetical protein
MLDYFCVLCEKNVLLQTIKKLLAFYHNIKGDELNVLAH